MGEERSAQLLVRSAYNVETRMPPPPRGSPMPTSGTALRELRRKNRRRFFEPQGVREVVTPDLPTPSRPRPRPPALKHSTPDGAGAGAACSPSSAAAEGHGDKLIGYTDDLEVDRRVI